ncbi:MAG TPA: hypothetical protein VFB28_13095 [Terriglobales bacterium]|nr:hypothetical protein [Terriglobales bacterium]
MASSAKLTSFPYATALRQELILRSRAFASNHALAHQETYGDLPVICYLPNQANSAHGNFLPETYRSILKNDNWRLRLEKVHTQARVSLPKADRRWRELDSCNSSDALLMNIFCFPGALKNHRVFDLLGIERWQKPYFGLKARVPLLHQKSDRTEVDMRLGNLLVEAKLTESDFQTAPCAVLDTYRDFHEIFDTRRLPRDTNRYLSYQLIRNVLAAYANDCSFCVMADARRPDLMEAWYAVMQAVRLIDLRLRCKMITWQELSSVLPRKLRAFLHEKYGIATGDPA